MPRSKNWKKRMRSLLDSDIITSFVSGFRSIRRSDLKPFTDSAHEASGLITRLQKLGILGRAERPFEARGGARPHDPDCRENEYPVIANRQRSGGST